MTTRDASPEVPAMSAALRETFEALQNDVLWLHSKWKLYCQLFGDPATVGILNEAAGFFAYAVQETLWHDVVLHLARLIDPKESFGNENLSLARLVALLDDSSLEAKVAGLLETVKDKCSFVKPWRHKRLAHRDLDHALATAKDPLPGISRADIEAALHAVRELLDAIQLYYEDTSTAYEHVSLPAGDGRGLLVYLKEGVAAEAVRRERFLSGTYTEDDLKAEH